jgi:DNA gyrase subunit A
MIINESGVTIRMPISEIRVMGRKTQGVKLISLGADDRIADVGVVRKDENDQDDHEDGGEEE